MKHQVTMRDIPPKRLYTDQVERFFVEEKWRGPRQRVKGVITQDGVKRREAYIITVTLPENWNNPTHEEDDIDVEASTDIA